MILTLLLSSYLWAKPTEEVKIPPPAVKPKPVARITGVFREALEGIGTQKTVDIHRTPRAPVRSVIYVTNMVMERMPDSLGEIVVTDTDTNTVGPFQYVLIRSDRVASGQLYTVVKDMGHLKWNPDIIKIEGKPHAMQVQGEIKILGAVKVPKLKETLWRAQVTKSYNPIEVGAQLSEVPVPKVDLTQKGVPARVDGEVIGGALDLGRKLLEPGATIYLNSGVIEGMRVGQLLEVYSTQSLYSVRAALVRVAYVDQQYATAVIVASDREVQPGDRLTRPE